MEGMNLKKASIQTLLLMRNWLDEILKEIGIHSNNEYNKMAAARRKDVDKELWRRIVSDKHSPYERSVF